MEIRDESVQDLVERNKPVLDALTLAAGPLSIALDAMRRVESSGPGVARMAATKVLEDALVGANQIQAMLDAIAPLRAALDAVEKVRLSARDGSS